MSYLFPRSLSLALMGLSLLILATYYLITIPSEEVVTVKTPSLERHQKREGIYKELFSENSEERVTIQAEQGELFLGHEMRERLKNALIEIPGHQLKTPEMEVNYQTHKITAQSVACQRKADFLHARDFTWDMDLQKGEAIQGSGTLQTTMGEIHFSADQLQLDHQAKTIILKNQVLVESAAFGSLTTDKTLTLYFNDQALERMIADGACQIVQNEGFVIECDGSVQLDLLSGTIDLNKGEMQVIYRDDHGIAMGDTATILFIKDPDKIVFKEVKITGEALVENRFGVQMPLAQYILSDEVLYYPEKKEIFVSALAGRRALFYDKLNNMTMSAPAFKVEFENNQPKVFGKDDVRLELAEKEWQMIKQRFVF